MSRFAVGKVRSKDLKLGPIEAKQCQEIHNYLDYSIIVEKQSEWFRSVNTSFYLTELNKT